MQNISDLVSTLDSQVLSALQDFDITESHLAWGTEFNQILSNMYASMVQTTKNDIRAVARDFQGQHRLYRLLHHTEDLIQRSNTLRVMLSVVDLLTMCQSRLEPGERCRIRQAIPNLHCTMRAIMERFSSWQDDVGAAINIFCVLEESEESVEELLASLPGTIPNAYVSQGKDLIDQLASMWAERRTIAVQAVGLVPGSHEVQQLVDRLNCQRGDQRTVIESFTGLLGQVVFRFHDLEFTARQLSGASSLYTSLCIRRRNISEQTNDLETVLDHLMEVVGASQE